VAHNSRDGRKKSRDAVCCVTTRRSFQMQPRQRARFPMASGPALPAVFAAGVPPPHVAGVPQVGIGTSVAVSLPANAAVP
jgi:hypothetical protein